MRIVTLMTLTFILIVAAQATPLRYETVDKTWKMDQTSGPEERTLILRDLIPSKWNKWLYSGQILNIKAYLKSKNGAGQAIMVIGDIESASQKIQGSPESFEGPDNFYELEFDYGNLSIFEKWKLILFDDEIKFDALKVTKRQALRRKQYEGVCRKKVANYFQPGIVYKRFMSSFLEEAYPDEKAAVIKRLKAKACKDVSQKCQKFVKRRRLIFYCKDD